MLLRAAPERLVSDWRKADKTFRSAWIELGTNYTLTADAARNEAALRKDAAALGQVLSVVEGIGDTGVLLVPDTNSLVDQPDPVMYRPIAGRDELKIAHKNSDVRDGASGDGARRW